MAEAAGAGTPLEGELGASKVKTEMFQLEMVGCALGLSTLNSCLMAEGNANRISRFKKEEEEEEGAKVFLTLPGQEGKHIGGPSCMAP